MASPAAPAPPAPTGVTLERGQTIDRFVVLGLVGRGGMGEVYAAYDPELDRKVAIKLLRARGDAADGRARLLREAQAIAKLSHPNVVVVYDVGTFGESVFIAMEFVDGHTLTGWMQAGRRTRREIMQVFLAAGRGLAAAHAAGLVHRDFKPDNVMVTTDGQVRVMDFGLARQTGDAPDPATRDDLASAIGAAADETGDPSFDPDPDTTMNLGKGARGAPRTTSGKYLSIKLTQTGAMLGTPAYMAPEQFAVRPTDARTDQFSFCVALYESLYDQRPFDGETFLALMTSVTTGAVRGPPAKTQIPGWLRKVVLRGLETDPERRHPSMTALLRALETDPTVRPKRLALGFGVLALVGLAAFGARRAAGAHQSMCQGGDARWAGVWKANGVASERKGAIKAAFDRSGKSYAEHAYTGATQLLDDYVRRWTNMYTEACEATHVRGEQSSEVLDLRMACLDERLRNVSALSDVFAEADGKVVENAVSAAASLPSLDRCADVALLRAVVKPPEDAKTRARVDELRGELARLIALRQSGKCLQAISMADALVANVRATGYQPLVAETLFAAGMVGDNCGDPAVMVSRFKAAHMAATASHDDEVAAQASSVIVVYYGNRLGQPASAKEWLEIAQGDVARLGHETLVDAWLAEADAFVKAADHDGNASIAAIDRAIEIKRRLQGPNHPDTLVSIMNRGDFLRDAGRLEEALETDEHVRADFERVLGNEAPPVAFVWFNQGEVLGLLGRHAEACEANRHAADIFRQSGADASFLGFALTGLGHALLGEKNETAAVAPLEEALAIRIEKHAAPAQLAETRFALAQALWAAPGTRRRALALATSARLDCGEDKKVRDEIDAWLARAKRARG